MNILSCDAFVDDVYAPGGCLPGSYRAVRDFDTFLQVAEQYYEAAVLVANDKTNCRLNRAFIYLAKHCCECCMKALLVHYGVDCCLQTHSHIVLIQLLSEISCGFPYSTFVYRLYNNDEKNELERYPNMFKNKRDDKKACYRFTGSKIKRHDRAVYVDVPKSIRELFGCKSLKARRTDIVQHFYSFVNVDYVLRECCNLINYVKSIVTVAPSADIYMRAMLFNDKCPQEKSDC